MKKLLVLFLSLALALTAVTALADEAAFTETVVSVPNGDHEIPATVCIPAGEGKFPAVVMLHGTGSNREEAGEGYKVGAPVLAEKYGIATIRIDFMGNGDSAADYTGYTFDSAVSDAVAAANYMKGLENIDGAHIGVMGWSQGGTDALLAASRAADVFSSVVTWAGAPDLSDMLSDALYEEAKTNGYFVMEFDWREPLHVSLQWCEDVKNTDVLKEFAENYAGPVLAIHGEQDTTVDPEWSNKIVAASPNPSSKTFFIPGMDHTFNVFSGEEYKSLLTAVDATGAFFAETLK
ncbi:MAG: alpha/beta fold hydrolase [Clostridia bacterium]|nr:alpha/beta fold hydrolase [Clostridia bacterium]